MHRRQFLHCVALLGSACLPGLTMAAAPRWSSASPLPLRMQELYPTVHQGKLLVAGGIARRLGLPYFSDACFSYDPQQDIWETISDLPQAMHHAALVSDGRQVLLAGGFHGGYTHIWRMHDTVYRLGEEGWQEDGRLPQAQAEGVLAANAQQDVHLVTGQSPRGQANRERSDHSEVADHWVRADGSSTWEPLAPIPTPRNSATGGWIGDQLLVTGGRTAEGNLQVSELYDLTEDRWRTVAPLPLPQAGTASVVVADGVIVFGGEIFQPEAAVFPNVWRYSLRDDSWSPEADMPTPRHGIGAGRIGGHAYVIGGATRPSGSGTSDVNEVFSLQPED